MLQQQLLSAPVIQPGLYLVATPIGNLGDITLRAIETLAACDLIACEDTRTSGVLLARYGIKRPKTSLTEYNAGPKGEQLLRRLRDGQSIALISDAGTPLISDPGLRLVQSAIQQGTAVVPLPGASAPIAALVASGLSSEQFVFAGFLPNKQNARKQRLEQFCEHPSTLIFFESPKRLAASLAAMVTVFGGERKAVVAREISKMHETFYRDDLAALAALFADSKPPKGEIVVLIEGAKKAPPDDREIDQQLLELLRQMPTKKAAAHLAKDSGLSKRTLYQRALQLKASDNDER